MAKSSKSAKTEELSKQLEGGVLSELVQDFLANQKTFKDVRGISDKEMEAVYTTAYNFYNHGKYEEGETVFKVLCQFNHYEQKYWIGLGACRQMMQHYDDAIEAYSYATMLNSDDPIPAFHAADCFIQTGKVDIAKQALEAVKELTQGKKDFKQMYDQADQLLEGLNKGTVKPGKKPGKPKEKKKEETKAKKPEGKKPKRNKTKA